ncbi:MAG TPA: peptidylprolyl isomerase [Terriglobia bacterium]|nr:peptidylprolyl isomerase [Terriglobia bacterium]
MISSESSIQASLALGAAGFSSPSGASAGSAKPEPDPGPSIGTGHPPGLYALIETTMGRIICELFAGKAPVTVQNFADLAMGKKRWYDAAERVWCERPYYNGLTFHRVIPDFMIQGGDYMGNGTGRVGYTFEDEFSADLTFDKPGLLAMANAGPNTNGAQFFVTVAPTPWLNHKHAIFGQVAEGQDVVNAISLTPRNVHDRPLQPVIMRRVSIIDTRVIGA